MFILISSNFSFFTIPTLSYIQQNMQWFWLSFLYYMVSLKSDDRPKHVGLFKQVICLFLYRVSPSLDCFIRLLFFILEPHSSKQEVYYILDKPPSQRSKSQQKKGQ
jgi:hypothetical protein